MTHEKKELLNSPQHRTINNNNHNCFLEYDKNQINILDSVPFLDHLLGYVRYHLD